VSGGERREPPGCLLELPLAADTVPAAGLIPGDRDVHEALEEVLLRGIGCTPGQLELLVRGEELAAPDQLEAGLKASYDCSSAPG
jgi:hypothetical protein